MKEALLYKKLNNNDVKCLVCHHQCLISQGQRGLCGVRENQRGKLYSLVYNKIIAFHLDPIEKKPLFHFLPNTYSLSVATMGCNFFCLHCQNYDISQGLRKNKKIMGEKISPKKTVSLALQYKVPSISYTYTEPTIFLEYALETMKLAKKQGLKNVWVSNGYFSSQTLKLITPYLDAINIDLKFFDSNFYQKICGGKLKPILNNLKLLKKSKIWLEITTLLIPGYTDKNKQLEEIALFIKKELGEDVPWHISAFYPVYKMNNISPTPLRLIERAVDIGQKTGLKYVYAGNLNINEDTFCPQCQKKVIERKNYNIKIHLKNDFCSQCGNKIPGIF